MERTDRSPASPDSPTVDLGEHTLEVLRDQAVFIVDHKGIEVVRLDSDETYKLLIALRELFK